MPTKNCPEFSRDVNVRKLFCDCGHVFTLRRTKRVGIKSWKSEMQALRAMEMVCDVSNRRINSKAQQLYIYMQVNTKTEYIIRVHYYIECSTTCTQLLSCMCE